MQFRGVMCLVHLDELKMGPTSMELTKFYLKLELRRALLYIYSYILNRRHKIKRGFGTLEPSTGNVSAL